jgi:hypothetical protein
MDITLSKETFQFKKPETWAYMTMADKISYYKTILDKKYAPFVDKLMAKDIVTRICGDLIQVPKVVRILEGPDDFHAEDLQQYHQDCILKTSHASGWNLILTPSTTVEEVKRCLHSWNKPYIGDNEKHYSFLKPRFFLEEKVNCAYSGKSGSARTFMFRCVRGMPISIGVRQGSEQTTYSMDGTPVEPIKIPLEKNPLYLDKMIQLAKRLSSPFEFVRIDFYLSDKQEIYFSEFTFTPSGGSPIFSYSVEKKFGAMWK